MLSHAIFTPGQPGWMDEVDRAIAEDEPDSFKGYTIRDNTGSRNSSATILAPAVRAATCATVT